MILLDYYNNMYEGHYEKWQSMTLVEKEDDWLKQIITVKEVKQRLRINYSHGWNFQNCLYTELDEWGNFKEKFKTLPENIQELIIKKIHCGTKVWCIHNIDH